MSAISLLTSRFSAAHPEARVEIRSMTSRAIERALEAFEIDAGVTYLDNEPLEHVRKVPLYRERYVFLSRREHVAPATATITWKEAAGKRLCLLSEDMQNRRIINKVAASIGVDIGAGPHPGGRSRAIRSRAAVADERRPRELRGQRGLRKRSRARLTADRRRLSADSTF
jgi:DNA-binding transcriptional LysR family regulator